jgi:hypothetical protein
LFAVKAIYKSKACTEDVFDAIDHAGTIFRNGQILTAYFIKS